MLLSTYGHPGFGARSTCFLEGGEPWPSRQKMSQYTAKIKRIIPTATMLVILIPNKGKCLNSDY